VLAVLLSDTLSLNGNPVKKANMENLMIEASAPKEEKEKIITLSDELAFCTKLSKIVNKEFFENTLPPFIITFQKLRSAYGAATIKPVFQDDNFQYYQMTIDPSSAKMDGTLAAVVDTIIHENIHFYCRVNNILEVSNNGRYHNQKFKELAEKCGLKCINNPTIGWNTINVLSEKLIALLLANFDEKLLSSLFKVSKPSEKKIHIIINADGTTTDSEPEAETGGRRGGTNNNLTAYICPVCGQKLRAGKNANFLCGNDNEKMIPVTKAPKAEKE